MRLGKDTWVRDSEIVRVVRQGNAVRVEIRGGGFAEVECSDDDGARDVFSEILAVLEPS